MADSILIFDSGVGGLSVLSQVRQQFPAICLNYLMDTEMFPYGDRDDDVLIQRILNVCVRGCEHYNPALLIVACNTASTLALSQLRNA
jgi:glutamate racemase